MAAEPINPYQAPESDPDRPLKSGGFRGPRDYEPLRSRAVVTVGLLVAGIVLGLISAASYGAQAAMLGAIARGEDIARELAEVNDLRVQLIAIAQVGLGLAIALAFLLWTNRAYENLPALGARDLQYSHGWAVGSFFVPFLNLVRPLLIFKEIWRASDPEPQFDARKTTGLARVPAVLDLWWTCWIVGSFAFNLIGQKVTTAGSIEENLGVTWALLGIRLLNCLTCLLAIAVVRGITARQDEKAGRIAETEVAGMDDAREVAVEDGPVDYQWGKVREFGDDPL